LIQQQRKKRWVTELMHRTKACSKCHKVKAYSEFYKDKRAVDGLKSECNFCHYIQSKRYRLSFKAILSAERYRKSERGQAIRKAWAQSEKGQFRRKSPEGKAIQKTYRQSDAGKEVQKKYWRSEKGKSCRARSKSKRRSKIKLVNNDLTLQQWQEILLVQENSCTICKINFNEKPATRDHIVPVSKGGGLTKGNVQALCQSCNSSKGNKTMKEYMRTEV